MIAHYLPPFDRRQAGRSPRVVSNPSDAGAVQLGRSPSLTGAGRILRSAPLFAGERA